MFNELKLETKHNACFAAGTLVHTDKGLVPIEKLKVGDMILSRHENEPNGELAYKRVKQTFKRENQPVIGTVISAINEEKGESQEELIITTYGHPFWVFNNHEQTDGKWEIAENINSSFVHSLKSKLNVVSHNAKLLRSTAPNKMFYVISEEGEGVLLDVNDYKNSDLNLKYEALFSAIMLSDFSRMQGNYDENGEFIFETFNTDVYNFEVEDFHTYFVGELGTWVHNTNCNRTELVPHKQGDLAKDVIQIKKLS